MSVPPSKLPSLGPAKAGPAPLPQDTGMSDQATPPMGSPMSTPEPKMGNKQGAMIDLSMAIDLIERALPALGSESDEGQKALAAIRSLTGVIGPQKDKTKSLQQSEILQMLQSLPPGMGAPMAGQGSQPPAPATPPAPPMAGAGQPM